MFKGVHNVDFSGVRDDKCHTGVGQSRVKLIKLKTHSDFHIKYIIIKSSYHHIMISYHQVKRIKLTTCSAGEFTCNDGQCINMEQR